MPSYPPFDIDPETFEALPNDRMYIKWPDGAGENVWAKKLPDGNLILNNSPLFPMYRYKDVVSRGGEVLKRHFAHRLLHVYEAAEDDEEDKVRRKALWDAAHEVGADLSFFSKGWGWVLVPHDADLKAVETALLAAPHVTKIEGHQYDPETDRERTLPLAEYLEAIA